MRRRRPGVEDVEVPDEIWLDLFGDDAVARDAATRWLEERMASSDAVLWPLCVRVWHRGAGASSRTGWRKCPCPAHADVRGLSAITAHVEHEWLLP